MALADLIRYYSLIAATACKRSAREREGCRCSKIVSAPWTSHSGVPRTVTAGEPAGMDRPLSAVVRRRAGNLPPLRQHRVRPAHHGRGGPRLPDRHRRRPGTPRHLHPARPAQPGRPAAQGSRGPDLLGDEPRAGHAPLHGHGLRRGARDGPAGSPPHHRGRPGEGDRDRLGKGSLRPPAPQPAATLQRDQERRRRRRPRGPGEGGPPPGAVAAGGRGLFRAADPADLLPQRPADAARSRAGVRGPGPAGHRLLLDRARQRRAARADALHGPGQRPRLRNARRASKPTPRGRSCCRSRSG